MQTSSPPLLMSRENGTLGAQNIGEDTNLHMQGFKFSYTRLGGAFCFLSQMRQKVKSNLRLGEICFTGEIICFANCEMFARGQTLRMIFTLNSKNLIFVIDKPNPL